MDTTRLQPAVNELAAAQAAYDTALKTLADATRRATQNPTDTIAAAAVKAANTTLTQARTRVETARVSLDAIRVGVNSAAASLTNATVRELEKIKLFEPKVEKASDEDIDALDPEDLMCRP